MLLKGEALKHVALAQLVNLMFSRVLLEVVSFSQYFLPCVSGAQASTPFF